MNRQAWTGILGAAFIACALVPSVAMAQFSDSYNFLKAVRDRDGQKVMDIITKPGSVIIDTRDQGTGEAALHIVTKRRDSTWLGFLLSRGAKPDVRDKDGNTPLMLATQVGYVEAVTVLLNARASVDMANNAGETPLIRAVQNRDSVTVRTLLAAGANADKKDRIAGMSARDYAARDTRAGAILKLLTEAKPVKAMAGPKI
jgi:uncharacterized protein